MAIDVNECVTQGMFLGVNYQQNPKSSIPTKNIDLYQARNVETIVSTFLDLYHIDDFEIYLSSRTNEQLRPATYSLT